jgi:hypothetical protein
MGYLPAAAEAGQDFSKEFAENIIEIYSIPAKNTGP